MKRTIFTYIIILLITAGITGYCSIEASAQPETTPDNKNEKKQESGFIPFALPYYMPETSWGVGFYLLYYKNQDKDQPQANPDETALYGTYTIKNQVSIGLSTDQYLYINKYKLSAAVEFSRFPDIFWGIGPKTGENDNEDFTSQTFHLRGSFLTNTGNNLYIGPAYDLVYDIMKEREKNGLLNTKKIKGRDGTIISSIGININWDIRNSVFYPTKGFYIDIKGFLNQQEWGNEYNFVQFQTDIRYFYQLYDQHVLGLQFMTDLTHGSVPMQAMHKLGGDMLMRGYYEGRYRDEKFYGLQLEYRFPVYQRFTGTLFGSIGEVAPTVSDLLFENEIKASFGIGVRYLVDKAEHIPLRFDVGFDKELNSNFYLIIKEAF